MDINNALSPLDGRELKISDVNRLFNNKILLKMDVECKYLMLFINILMKNNDDLNLDISIVANMYKSFINNIDNEIKKIDIYEKETNHDIKLLLCILKIIYLPNILV